MGGHAAKPKFIAGEWVMGTHQRTGAQCYMRVRDRPSCFRPIAGRTWVEMNYAVLGCWTIDHWPTKDLRLATDAEKMALAILWPGLALKEPQHG